MPSSFRLINVALAGKGVNDPDFKKAHSLPLSLQDLLLVKASSLGNKTVLRERNLLKALNPKPFRSHHTLLKKAKKK